MAERNMEAIIISPNAGDLQLTQGLLLEAGIRSVAASNVAELIARLPDDAGCALIVSEALDQGVIDVLTDVLSQQPAWCDFPLIFISAESEESAALIEQLFPSSGNLTLLTRPLSPATLVSAVRVVLRARARQYEVRELLQQREESIRQRDEFLAMLAHELRNPLAPIRTGTHIMKSFGINDPVFVRTRSLIEKQVVHITRLVDDLLDVSRLERGKIQLQFEVLPLGKLIQSAVESSSTIIQERRHTLHLDLCSEPLFVAGDSVRLEQIILNLITNAAKYTPAGGKITVHTETLDGNAVLWVEDNGVGISAGLEHRIFDLFQQDKRTLARAEGGLGIGLTVVKRLVELHHGTIKAESFGVNKGSRFTVTFPLAKEHSRRSNELDKPGGNDATRRVLIVEDNADIRETMQLLLQMWGHEVHFAETGPDGVRRASELKPDVAIIDIGLPGLSGYEVARQIRTNMWNAATRPRLIALTGYGQPSDIAAAKEAGFDTHLLKPIDADVLNDVLRDITGAMASIPQSNE